MDEGGEPPAELGPACGQGLTVENVVRAEQTMFAQDGFSGTTRELLKVERIQNRTLLKRYRAEREIITSGAARRT